VNQLFRVFKPVKSPVIAYPVTIKLLTGRIASQELCIAWNGVIAKAPQSFLNPFSQMLVKLAYELGRGGLKLNRPSHLILFVFTAL